MARGVGPSRVAGLGGSRSWFQKWQKREARKRKVQVAVARELPGVARRCPELQLPGAARSCPELPGAARRYPELPGAARSCPELPGVFSTSSAIDSQCRDAANATRVGLSPLLPARPRPRPPGPRSTPHLHAPPLALTHFRSNFLTPPPPHSTRLAPLPGDPPPNPPWSQQHRAARSRVAALRGSPR